MNAFSLAGKTIFVTGASSGIGRQICVAASNHGATVIASGRNEAELKVTLEALNPEQEHRSLVLDLYELGKLPEVAAGLPPLDGIVHCAGVVTVVPFKFVAEKDIRFTQTLNYEAPILLTQALLKKKLIRRGGSIVFIASVGALIGIKGNSLYAGSKGALIATARALAMEIAGQKIRANCISPGLIETPLTQKVQESISAEALKETEKHHPLGFGTTDDVANATVFMLADASRWITGTNLVVDGGVTAQ